MEKSLIQIAEEAQKMVDAQLEEVEKLKVGLNLRQARVKKAERDAQEKEKQLAEWDKALNKKYEEVSRLENARFMEVKASQQNEHAGAKLEEAKALVKKAEADLAEAKQLRAEITEHELAVTAREKDMRERIRREVADSLLTSFTGKKQ